MDISKHFFIDRVVRGWNWLPREAVEPQTLEGFKRGMEVWPSGPRCHHRLGSVWVIAGLELQGLFQQKRCYDSHSCHPTGSSSRRIRIRQFHTLSRFSSSAGSAIVLREEISDS